MNPSASGGLSLYDAARAMGVVFGKETVPRDGVVNAGGLDFHYLEWGDVSSPAVVLLHGFAQTCHSWDFISLALSGEYRVIAIDQRGHGDSDWAPDGDYSPEKHQIDIAGIVEGLHLRDFVLMGLSMGGRNAFTFASNHPDNVKALVIVDAGPQNMQTGRTNIRNFVQQDDELDSIDAFVERVLKYNPRRDATQVKGSIMHNLKQLDNGNWTWKYDKLLRAEGRPMAGEQDSVERLWEYLEKLSCPTLIVRGADSDIIAMDTAESMTSKIPYGRLATVEGAGHLVMGDNPSGFLDKVNEFLNSL